MGESFLKLITTPKPGPVYLGEPLECDCGSRATIDVRIGRTVKAGKVTAGQKQIRCADCGNALWG